MRQRPDGVHPTTDGYAAIARLVAQCITDKGWLDHRRIVCFGDSITFGSGAKGAGTVEGESYPARLKSLLSQ